jgi:hypothetical protein
MFLGATLAVLSRSDDYCALFQPCELTSQPPARTLRFLRKKAKTKVEPGYGNRGEQRR